VLYANVVLGLPIEGPFDYLVPADLERKISVGARVWVDFSHQKTVAYVVNLSHKTKIKRIKEVLAVIDPVPLLDAQLLGLAVRLADYYCCSRGQAIESALPDELRKGKAVTLGATPPPFFSEAKKTQSSLRFIQGNNRIAAYLKEIRQVWSAGQSVIVLFSDIPEAERARELFSKHLGTEVFLSFRKQPKELEIWERIRASGACIVVGTRSNIFSPVNNLGLIIVDQEEDQVYKQEQVPHYHAREAACMRGEVSGAKVILGSQTPSLESFYLAEKNKLSFEIMPSASVYPEIKIIDLARLAYAERKSKSIFSKFLADAIYSVLTQKGKVLLLVNRKGFATAAACHNCGKTLKCPRCNINLVFHFEEDTLKCHHCNFKMEVPEICPSCNAGYIKYSGTGTEKVESEVAKVFPQARVKLLGEEDRNAPLLDADIFVATSAAIKYQELNFDLIGVMLIDNALNRVDFRAAEKTFMLLRGLTGLTTKKIIIQSANANHHCFRALIKNDVMLFLREELKIRKQLNFAPFKHMILLKLRGPSLEKVKKVGTDLFDKLNRSKTSSIKMLAFNPGQPAKLRGNFYYQILMRATSAEKATHFLKLHLKSEHYSGIIVTVDVDPV